MSPKEFLTQAAETEREILRREERVRALRRMASRLSARLRDVRVQTSPDPGRTQELLAEAADEETEVNRLREERAALLAEIALTISRVPDPVLARLLEYRYLENKGWPEIAGRLRVSERYAYRLHREALDSLPVPPAPRD